MKEAIVHPGPKVTITDSPVPKPNDDQLVIKVVVSGSNPKDWKVPEWMNKTGNSGDDIAGIVHEVGKNVYEFKPGDRVMAFHEMVRFLFPSLYILMSLCRMVLVLKASSCGISLTCQPPL